MNPTIIANWKMQLGLGESSQLARQMVEWTQQAMPSVSLIICPSYIALQSVGHELHGSIVMLGAQDVFWAERGAFTGEESPLTIRETGGSAVIIGHSERRQMGETNDQIGRKALAALTHGLMPIICVGESADERTRGQHEMAVQKQLTTIFRSTPPPNQGQIVYVAYEPIWAVGTGEPADPDEAEAIRVLIHRTLIDLYPAELVDRSFRMLYGGSVDANNISNYVQPGRYQGSLIGTASQKFDTFTKLIESVAPAAITQKETSL